jgi:hypothetical protein
VLLSSGCSGGEGAVQYSAEVSLGGALKSSRFARGKLGVDLTAKGHQYSYIIPVKSLQLIIGKVAGIIESGNI